jgi:type II secretion system protein H
VIAIRGRADKKRGENPIYRFVNAALIRPGWEKNMAKIRFKENRGFSLIELCMVMAVMAVTAAIAVPMLTSSMKDMQLASDARKIASTLSYAKLSATAKMTSYQLTINVDQNTWFLGRRQSPGSTVFVNEGAVNELSLGMANSGIAFEQTSPTNSAPGLTNEFLTTSSTSITFNSRGVPNGTAIVYLSNDQDTYFAVSVSLAGKVQVWRYRDSQWAPA